MIVGARLARARSLGVGYVGSHGIRKPAGFICQQRTPVMNNNLANIADFNKKIVKLFASVFAVKHRYPSNPRFLGWEIETLYRLMRESALLEFDAAIWVPIKGSLKSGLILALDITRINDCYVYNFGIRFIATYYRILYKIRKEYGESLLELGMDIFRDKVSNDIVGHMIARIDSYRVSEKHIGKLIAFFDGYGLNKGVVATFVGHRGMNVVAFYRGGSADDFHGNEHLFVKNLMPLLHVLISIKTIPWFAIFEEETWRECFRQQQSEGDFLAMLHAQIDNIQNFRKADSYKIYASDQSTAASYVFLIVRIRDFNDDAAPGSLLAVAAFRAEDFRADGKYYSIYGRMI